MEEKEIEKTIEKIKNAMVLIENLDLYNYTFARIRLQNQKQLNKSYDILFKLKKHLEYLLRKQGLDNEKKL